nr:DUF4234 domain-containing protein [Kibdelosporangium sp. MJ126-NF4]
MTATLGRAMKRRSPLAVWLGLPVITLGIYGFVWYYKIHREMADFHRKPDSPTTGPLLVMVLLGATLVAPLISFYRTGQRIQYAQQRAGIEQTCSPVVGTLLGLVLGAGVAYYQSELNKIVDSYGKPEGAEVPLHGTP